ncbi:MAG TPA: GNAT family N-acetyltransferase [Candidatus Fimadaptatus faecigallinarum]|uniref:GNAT family N-acetyltransferase n=1 Tax=Candidatus Fimadaptatus faecigallinarum TaxID=2840814 RepID=A0A9D1LPJ4_9FIRM|nr:GNAT family N-acetyltransferase [Candidatus Fimadaptatus faecigallinarum]
MFTISPIAPAQRPAINALIASEWAGPIIVSRGAAHDTSNANGFMAMDGDTLVGYALYEIAQGQCELLVLQSMVENTGVGTALINAVIDVARAAGCVRVWLITTNDNLHAIRFYQRFGFELDAVRIGAIAESRKLKPSIPLTGCDDIPIKHEFEFGYAL